jgi:hypothetical protein
MKSCCQQNFLQFSGRKSYEALNTQRLAGSGNSLDPLVGLALGALLLGHNLTVLVLDQRLLLQAALGLLAAQEGRRSYEYRRRLLVFCHFSIVCVMYTSGTTHSFIVYGSLENKICTTQRFYKKQTAVCAFRKSEGPSARVTFMILPLKTAVRAPRLLL